VEENKHKINELLQIEHKMLPLRIIFKGKDGKYREYILKTNNDGTVIFLNKREY
jgi:hypothetical protein